MLMKSFIRQERAVLLGPHVTLWEFLFNPANKVVRIYFNRQFREGKELQSYRGNKYPQPFLLISLTLNCALILVPLLYLYSLPW